MSFFLHWSWRRKCNFHCWYMYQRVWFDYSHHLYILIKINKFDPCLAKMILNGELHVQYHKKYIFYFFKFECMQTNCCWILFCRITEKWWTCYSIKCQKKEIIDLVETVRSRVINLTYWEVGDLLPMLSAVQMTDTMSRRPYPNMNVSASQTHKDVTDDRYRDLRRPRKVRFFVNGDRYFKGKKLYITPHRYFNFNDLLNDLTGKLPSNLSLPYGVRQIFTPVSGRRVTEIEDLSDGENYVCAGFEGFKTIKYGKAELEPWSVGM